MTQAVHFETADGKRHVGRLDGDVIVSAGEASAAGFVPDADGWAAIVAADGERFPMNEVHVLAPVLPGKILAIGLNYQAHVEETNLARPDVPVGSVISEYVDVAHAFYDKRESGFVNGLLDAIAKEARPARA